MHDVARMKKTRRKLELDTQTIRVLSNDMLANAAGGGTEPDPDPLSGFCRTTWTRRTVPTHKG